MKDTTVAFQSYQFYEQRMLVQNAMFDKVFNGLNEYTNGAVELMNLQTSGVDLDDSVLDRLLHDVVRGGH